MQVRSQTHHGDGDLVFQSVFRNGASGNVQVADVVQSVEVADRGDAVFLEHLGMEVNDVGGLGRKSDHVDTAGKGLQIDIRADRFTPFVHHFESIFLAVEIESLEAGAAADFEICGAGFFGRDEGGQEVFGFHAGSETGLEAVAEGAIHVIDFFHFANVFLI